MTKSKDEASLPSELKDLTAAPYNPRSISPEADRGLDGSMTEFGDISGLWYNIQTGNLGGGHQRKRHLPAGGKITKARSATDKVGTVGYGVIEGKDTEWPVRFVDWPLWKEQAANVAANSRHISGQFTADLGPIVQDLQSRLPDLTSTLRLGELLKDLPGLQGMGSGDGTGGSDDPDVIHRTLREQFLVPPFSILDARLGFWQERKRSWLALGLASELGRGETADGDHVRDLSGIAKSDLSAARVERESSSNLTGAAPLPEWAVGNNVVANIAPGTSVFDPVLCEILYTWFCPVGGSVLDPFAGGSVRGVVASTTGRLYTGVELREEQIKANRMQWDEIKDSAPMVGALPDFSNDSLPAMTPIEQRGDYWVKRDDVFCIGGGRGGKVRTCWTLAQGAEGLVTAGSRSSPQVNIVAQIARRLGIPCHVHVPQGKLTPELRQAQQAGAEVVQHKAGRNNVIIARARDDAAETGWLEIPFGMECQEAVDATASQVKDLPEGVKRIVVPVGSGMTLAGILTGLVQQGLDIPVVGVKVGANPTKRLNKWAPKGWSKLVTLVDSGQDYHEQAKQLEWEDIRLDSIYEAKCISFLEAGDLFWIIGIRASEAPQVGHVGVDPEWIQGDAANINKLVKGKYDFILSCPPYYDLEVYSDLRGELSALDSYEDFLVAYRQIISETASKLKADRFACFVVGDIRDKHGNYRNFVSDTIEACLLAGLQLYNEAILITAFGTLPIRAPRIFNASRKLGKTHQNVLVFVKGKGKTAADKCGVIEVYDMETSGETKETC